LDRPQPPGKENVNVPDPPEIGSRLRAARERLGWKREALAFHSGISWAAIAQIESGRRPNARPSTLLALSDALGVTLDYLVRGTSSPPPMFEHRALIYDGDEALLNAVRPFVEVGGGGDEALLAVTSESKIDLLRRHLGPAAESIEFADSSRWYGTPAAALDRYRKFCDDSLKGGARWIRVIGEPVWKGRSDSEVEEWTRYESLINLVFAGSPVSLLCPYDARTLDPMIVRSAHTTHPHTAGESGTASSPDYAYPGTFVLDSRKGGHA
jgi:transcriptional regulator with XRE-family HTH domain